MFRENEWQYDPINHKLLRILGMAFFVTLLIAICFLSALLLNQPNEPLPPVQQEVPAVLPLTGPPVSLHFIYLPVARSAPVSEPANIWEVTKIDPLGYALQGQRYDLATFTRTEDQIMVQGYCINRGWDVPLVGTDYWLNAEDTFVPVQEPARDPFQRFLKIQ